MSDAPVDLYIAAYSDPDTAQEDWDGIKQLARDKVIAVDGLLLVGRDADGKIEVKDTPATWVRAPCWARSAAP